MHSLPPMILANISGSLQLSYCSCHISNHCQAFSCPKVPHNHLGKHVNHLAPSKYPLLHHRAQVLIGLGVKKPNKKLMARIITWKTKGKPKERQKDARPTRTKEGRELVPLMVGSYLTHNRSNVACMQIMRSNSNRRSITSFSRLRNPPLYNRS